MNTQNAIPKTQSRLLLLLYRAATEIVIIAFLRGITKLNESPLESKIGLQTQKGHLTKVKHLRMQYRIPGIFLSN